MGEKQFLEEVSPLEESVFLKFAVESCPCAIFLIAPDSSFYYVNDAAADSTGYSRKELLTMGVPDIDPWFNAREWPHHFKEVKEQGMQKIETRHKRKDSSLIAVEIHTHFLPIDSREYLCAFATDITQRAQNAELLVEMATRFEYLFNEFPRPVMVIDETGMILGANKNTCDALGYNVGELVGKLLVDFMGEESKVHYHEMFESVLKENDVHCEITYLRSDGEKLKVNCYPIVITDENEDILSVLLFLDEF